jgi:5,10-methylenetetrahydromethanopterin reductase
MKVGIMVGEGSGAEPELCGLLERGRLAELHGLDTAWIADIGLDAITLAAILGTATNRIEIGTAAVPIFTRHPVAMIKQANTAQLACEGRFTLGAGLAHKLMVEDMWGLSYDKPAKHMRAYLEVIAPALRGEPVQIKNEFHQIDLSLLPPIKVGATPILIAALGPMMLRIAGEHTGGTITWATGPKTLCDHIVPLITSSAERAGREPPRIVAGMPVLLTKNVDQAREMAKSIFAVYAQVPSYRAMLDREGVNGLEDLAIIGSEIELRAGIDRLASAGVTDLCVFPFETEAGEIQRTIEFLGQR